MNPQIDVGGYSDIRTNYTYININIYEPLTILLLKHALQSRSFTLWNMSIFQRQFFFQIRMRSQVFPR